MKEKLQTDVFCCHFVKHFVAVVLLLKNVAVGKHNIFSIVMSHDKVGFVEIVL